MQLYGRYPRVDEIPDGSGPCRLAGVRWLCLLSREDEPAEGVGGADVGEVKPADAVRHLRSFCTHRVVIANSGTLRGEDAVRGRRHLLIPGGESSGGPRSLAAGGAERSYYETMVLNLTRFQ